jgi:hypothetical protein
MAGSSKSPFRQEVHLTAPDGTRRDQDSTEDRKEAAGSNLKTLTK